MGTTGNVINIPYLDMGKLFLDSGAYSVRTGAIDKLDVTEYSKFVNSYRKYCSRIASPDVIRDAKQTEINTRLFASLVEPDCLHKIFTVYHCSDKSMTNLKNVIKYTEELGIGNLALGGLAGARLKKEEKRSVFRQIAEVLPNPEDRPFDVHMFGVMDMDPIKIIKPNTVDSASALAISKKYQLMTYDPKSESLKATEIYGHLDRETMCRRLHYHYHKRIEIVNKLGMYGEFPEYTLEQFARGFLVGKGYRPMICAVNLLEILRLEYAIRKKLVGNFTYFVTFDSGTIMCGGILPALQNHYQLAYKDRCLMSYASFIDQKYKSPIILNIFDNEE